jgi:hypothetical protein
MAYQTAELDDRVARVEQLTDAELMRVAGREREGTRTLQPQKLLDLNSR